MRSDGQTMQSDGQMMQSDGQTALRSRLVLQKPPWLSSKEQTKEVTHAQRIIVKPVRMNGIDFGDREVNTDGEAE